MKVFGFLILVALVIWVLVEVVKCFKKGKSTECCDLPPAVRPLSQVLPKSPTTMRPAVTKPSKAVAKKKVSVKKKTIKK